MPRPATKFQPKITPGARESLAGLVERVTYHNEESGFAVVRIQVKGHRDLVTVVGELPSVSPGEWLVAEGEWVRDRNHGLQLKADLLRCTPPTSLEGIEKYLGSGMIKGIGPKYAKKLVAKFGENIFDIIENSSIRLQEVEGIGESRRKLIKGAWAEQKVVREIMVFLHSQGVSTSRALRIYKLYGEKAIELVRANPYRLAIDLTGVGFKTADQIAQRAGIPTDSLLRAAAGLNHTLSEATNAGHCALPRELLVETATKLLEIDPSLVEQALARMIERAEVIAESLNGENLIYLPNLRKAEQNVTERILALVRKPAAWPPIDLPKAIEWCEGRTGKTLAAQQREALDKLLATRLLVITGGPGVGKTTLINSILLILRAKSVRCVLCAPTGRAAKRLTETTGIAATTIHRLLEYSPAAGCRFHSGNPLEGDLFIIDETSMVDLPLMSNLLSALPASASLIIVGDVDQLPSVGPGRVLGDLIDSGVVPVVRLTEIFRQAAGSRIITSAHAINHGHLPELESITSDSDFFFIERDEPEKIVSAIIELIKKRIPAKLGCDPIADIAVLSPMNRNSLGTRELNTRLQEAINPSRPGELRLEKYGWRFQLRDKVIQTRNNYDKEVFNGDIGLVAAIDMEEQLLTVNFDGRRVPYEFGELDELSPAYAMTIHKSQGSEFPAVIIPLAMQHYMLLQRNLLYTAITRGKKMVVIVGQKKAFAAAAQNQETRRRYGGLLARLKFS